MTSPLSIAQGLEIQRLDLQEWRKKLAPACFAALAAEAERQNDKLDHKTATGYDVWRGDNPTTFVCNWNP
jgi:hypothetical protein